MHFRLQIKLHRQAAHTGLIAQLGKNHPQYHSIHRYIEFLNSQKSQHDAVRMKTLGGEMTLEQAYVDQLLTDAKGKQMNPHVFIQQFLKSDDPRVFISAGGGMGKSTLSKKLISLLTDPRILALCHEPELKVQEVDLRGYSVASLPSTQSLDPSTIIVIDGIDEIDPQVLNAYMSSLADGVRVIGLGRHDVTHHFSRDTKQYGLDVSDFESRLVKRYTQLRPGLRGIYDQLKQKLHFDMKGRQMAPLQIEALIKLAEDTELSGELSNISRTNIYEYMVRDIIRRDIKKLQTIGSLQKFDTVLYSKDKEQLFQYLIRSGYRMGKNNHVHDRSKADILALQDEYLTAYQGETNLTSDSFKDFVERFLMTTSLLVHSGPTDRYRVFHETARESFLNLKGGTVQKLNGDEYLVMTSNTYERDYTDITEQKLLTMMSYQSDDWKQKNGILVNVGQYNRNKEVWAIKTSAVEELIKQRTTIPQTGDELLIDEQEYIVLGRDDTKNFEGWTFKSIMNRLGRQESGALEPYIHQLDYTLRSGESSNQLHEGGIAVSKEFLSLLCQGKAKVNIQPTQKFVSYETDYQVNLPVKTLNYNIPQGTTELIDEYDQSFHRISKNTTEHYFKLLGYIKKQGQERINQHCFLIQDDQAEQYQFYISDQCQKSFTSQLGETLERGIDSDMNAVQIDGKTYYYVGSGITWSLGQDGVLSFEKGKDKGKSLFTKVKKLDTSLLKQAITPAGKTVDVIDEATLRELLATRKPKPSTEEQLIETLSSKQNNI